MTRDSLDQRLIDLEIRLAHHERMAEEVSDILSAQAAAIDRLTAQIRHLRERLGEAEAGWGRSPQDEKPPPHY